MPPNSTTNKIENSAILTEVVKKFKQALVNLIAQLWASVQF